MRRWRSEGRRARSVVSSDVLSASISSSNSPPCSRTSPAEKVAEPHGITAERAETLLGGTLVLSEIAQRLGCQLDVGRGGLREGAALALARADAAAA